MTKPPPELPDPGIALTTAVRSRRWLPTATRCLRVRRDGVWCWRSAQGGSHALLPESIAWGPGQTWLTVEGRGYSRPVAALTARRQRRLGPQRLTVFAGSVTPQAWRRLCVAALWRSRSAPGDAP